MAQTIYWSPPDNSTTGSVLIYRAVDNISDEAEIRTLIDTIAAQDVNNVWVTSYTDLSGTIDNYYRIQFFDNVGSSTLSDPVSGEYSEILATFKDVSHILRFSSNSDIGSDEVYAAIEDCTNDIYDEYGDPMRVSTLFLRKPSTNSYPGSLVYDFTGNDQPVWQLKQVVVGNTDKTLVSGSSYILDNRNGNVAFEQAFVDAHEGENCRFYWVPQIFNNLCKNMAGLQILEDSYILQSGEDTESSKVLRLEKRITKMKEHLRPKVLVSDNMYDGYDERGPGLVIEQHFEGQF